jgi:hypothetical protein
MIILFVSLILKLPFINTYRKNIHQLTMNLVLYLIGPIIATYIGDTTCLYYVFVGEAPITAPYSYLMPERPICVNLEQHTECVLLPELQQTTTTYTPPFIYSYQCASSLLTSYVPVFIYSYTISGVMMPLCLYCFILMEDWRCSRRRSTSEQKAEAKTNLFVKTMENLGVLQLLDVCFDNTVYRPRASHIMDQER